MANSKRLNDWASSIVSNQEGRQKRLRNMNAVESTCAILAAICAVVAVWGFTSSGTLLEGIRAETVGGVAVLCFSALMFVAAGAGIQKRFIAVISELEKRG